MPRYIYIYISSIGSDCFGLFMFAVDCVSYCQLSRVCLWGVGGGGGTLGIFLKDFFNSTSLVLISPGLCRLLLDDVRLNVLGCGADIIGTNICTVAK